MICGEVSPEPGTMAARNMRRKIWHRSNCCDPSTMAGCPARRSYRSFPNQAPGPYIDTHCHLDYAILNQKFGSYENWVWKTGLCWWWEMGIDCHYGDLCACAHGWEEYRQRPEVDIADAVKYFSGGLLGKGCAGLITSCSEVESIKSTTLLIEAGRRHLSGSVYCSFGMHPHNYGSYNEESRAQLVAGAESCGDKLIAWGECGLDYVKNKSACTEERRKMMAVFESQVLMAKERGLPLVVHARGAEEDTLLVLRRAHPQDAGLHIHGYQESPQMMQELFHRWPNCYIGLAGLVSYPHLEDVVKQVPLDRFVL
eukprot:gnl/MRDRNA2_/MRDRNA2_58260_c0_seq2.p1 gnl/MRDRNA2_/MRDRNA2_58260_c0~~gnl/MRDRNA2_/MRDRNA2_58260_c0_seq2.p1  ORF type:complete len:312 (+),score=34.75 gnl/MRDRNA2_/MRDRNA2_58260_c0_seq2:54-989(+)